MRAARPADLLKLFDDPMICKATETVGSPLVTQLDSFGMYQSKDPYDFVMPRPSVASVAGWTAFWAISMCLHQVASALVTSWGREVMHKAAPLPDLGHMALPNLQPYRWIPEVLVHWPLVAAGIAALCRFDIGGLKHFLQSHAFCMLLRALCFSLTLLPDASQMCEDSQWSGACHDLIFSGHIVALMLATLYLWPFKSWRLVLVLNAVLASLMTVAVRNHYSVDVVVSLVVAPAVWLGLRAYQKSKHV